MTLQTILATISLIGIGTILGTFIYIGRRLQALDELNKTVNDELKPDLKDVRERFIVVEERVDNIWKDRTAPAASPRQLNDKGQSILDQSGIKEMVDSRHDELLQLVREKKATNAYDAEKAIIDVMNDFLKHYPQEENKLKDGAFRSGADIDTVLFVGGIYLRNLIFKDLGFQLDDLDKPQ